MFINCLRLLTAFLMLMHFTGVTQLVSSYAKDKTSFVNMASMTEEETKKEKDNKEDDEQEVKELSNRRLMQMASLIDCVESFKLIMASQAIIQPHGADKPTPPPDFLA